jgi:hypothetical protein
MGAVTAAGLSRARPRGVAMSTLRSLPRDAPFEQQLRAYRLDHARRRMGDLDSPCPDRLWRLRERAKSAADPRVAEQAKRRRLLVQ